MAQNPQQLKVVGIPVWFLGCVWLFGLGFFFFLFVCLLLNLRYYRRGS